MESLLVMLVIVAGLNLSLAINDPNCGKRPLFRRNSIYGNDGKIVGGAAVIEGDHPWQVSIFSRLTGFFPYAHSCGGSIIDPYTILTAAHCTQSTV